MKSDNKTLIAALRILVEDIDSTDGIPNSVVSEAADRIEEMEKEIAQIHKDYGCEKMDPCGTIWDYAANLKSIIKILPSLWEEGYRTAEQDGSWHLFRKDGEGMVEGTDFFDLCSKILVWNSMNSHNLQSKQTPSEKSEPSFDEAKKLLERINKDFHFGSQDEINETMDDINCWLKSGEKKNYFSVRIPISVQAHISHRTVKLCLIKSKKQNWC